jgi:hypothetical protein
MQRLQCDFRRKAGPTCQGPDPTLKPRLPGTKEINKAGMHYVLPGTVCYPLFSVLRTRNIYPSSPDPDLCPTRITKLGSWFLQRQGWGIF